MKGQEKFEEPLLILGQGNPRINQRKLNKTWMAKEKGILEYMKYIAPLPGFEPGTPGFSNNCSIVSTQYYSVHAIIKLERIISIQPIVSTVSIPTAPKIQIKHGKAVLFQNHSVRLDKR